MTAQKVAKNFSEAYKSLLTCKEVSKDSKNNIYVQGEKVSFSLSKGELYMKTKYGMHIWYIDCWI